MAQNSQTWQLQAILDTYTYSRSACVPIKTLTVRKIPSYNDLQKLVKLHFCSSSLLQLNCTLDGFYTKRLLSLACVILDQQNLHNVTQSCVLKKFPYLLEAIYSMGTCIPRFIVRWGSSALGAGPWSRMGRGSREHKHII